MMNGSGIRRWRGISFLARLAIALVFIALVLCVSPVSFSLAQTPSINDLKQQQQQIEQERSHLNEQQDQLHQLEQTAQQRLGNLNTAIQATSEQIAQNEQKLQAANRQLSSLETNLTRAEKNYQAKQAATAARLRFLQRQTLAQGWAVLLQSQSMDEWLDRRYQLRRIYQGDRQFLQELKTDADDLEQQRRGIEQQKNQISLLVQQLLAQKAESQAEAQTQQANIERFRQDRRALEAAEDQLVKDSASIATLIQQRIAAQAQTKTILRGGTGLMSFPSDGPITSSFGYRVHPILGYTRFHAGIDFGADYGSPIRAADSGTVIFAGWYSGYGQAVILDHGGNITTLYGHTSEIYVTEGQTVQRGQAIAAVGSTGFSTGPHLHFEVRVSGEPVDPSGYL